MWERFENECNSRIDKMLSDTRRNCDPIDVKRSVCVDMHSLKMAPKISLLSPLVLCKDIYICQAIIGANETGRWFCTG